MKKAAERARSGTDSSSLGRALIEDVQLSSQRARAKFIGNHQELVRIDVVSDLAASVPRLVRSDRRRALNVAELAVEIASRLANTPIWIFHGDADESVPVSEARQMAAALTAVKAKFKYTEYPGVGHNSWDNAYAEPDLFPWMLEQSLKH